MATRPRSLSQLTGPIADYQAMLVTARQQGLALAPDQARQLLQILKTWSRELAKDAAGGTGNALQLKRLIGDYTAQLQREIAKSVIDGVHLTIRTVTQMHARATVRLLEAAGLPEIASGLSFTGLNAAAAQSVLSRPQLGMAIRNLREECRSVAQDVITRGVARGASSTQLARGLMTSVLGSDGVSTDILSDRRRIGYQALKDIGLEATPENLAAFKAHAGRVAMRANLIARTETLNAEHEAGVRAAEESPVVDGLQWKVSNRHPTEDVCDTLAKTDFYGLGPGVYDPRKVPPRPHPRCFLPGTIVAGSFVRGFRAQYDGEVVQIKTASGHHLAVTVNHPVLTPTGFVPAAQLELGGQLVCYGREIPSARPPGQLDEQQAPAAIEQVFGALREAGEVTSVERSPEDLYGDASFGEGEIEIVGVDCELEFDGDVPPKQEAAELAFMIPNMELQTVAGVCARNPGSQRIRPTPLGGMRGLGDAKTKGRIAVQPSAHPESLRLHRAPDMHSSLNETSDQHGATHSRSVAEREHRLAGFIARDETGQTRHIQALELGSASGIDAGLPQPTSDGRPVDAVLAAELLQRFAGTVSTDHIVEIRRMHYVGHVYDLQSVRGWIVAEGIFASNCLCSTRTVLRPTEEWGTERDPAPELDEETLQQAGEDFTPSGQSTLRKAFAVAERRPDLLPPPTAPTLPALTVSSSAQPPPPPPGPSIPPPVGGVHVTPTRQLLPDSERAAPIWVQIPPPEQELLSAGNVTIEFAEHSLGGVRGFYAPETRQVVVGPLPEAIIHGTTAHEIGHAVDNLLEVINRAQAGSWFWSRGNIIFRTAVIRELGAAASTPYGQYLRTYYHTQEDRIAEVFADLWATQRTNRYVRAGAYSPEQLRQLFPEASALVEQLTVGG